MTILTLVRGLPGSGKSTVAAALAAATGAMHVEADMYFMEDGEYKFSITMLGKAHEWCKSNAYSALKNGRNVVVANTFTRQWEVDPYLVMAKEFGCDVQIIECTAPFDNIHNVPDHTISDMGDRWEQIHV